MKPSLRTLYFPSTIWHTATVRVNTRKLASSGISGMACLRKSYAAIWAGRPDCSPPRRRRPLRVERRDRRVASIFLTSRGRSEADGQALDAADQRDAHRFEG